MRKAVLLVGALALVTLVVGFYGPVLRGAAGPVALALFGLLVWGGWGWASRAR